MKQLTGRAKSMIGMIHVAALPGTPRAALSPTAIVERAVAEARLLADAGFDALLLENMHDTPYLKRQVGPEIVAVMAAATQAVAREVQLPLGIQILAGANEAAIAVAHATGARFVRAEGFVFGHMADEGLIESDAGSLLRYRRAIGAEGVMVCCDIKKKHSSHAITADVSLGATAHAAEFFGADAVIVTGTATGSPTDPADLEATRGGTHLPILVGSGTTPENLPAQWPLADAFIVGSWIKKNGHWAADIDPSRAVQMVEAARKLG